MKQDVICLERISFGYGNTAVLKEVSLRVKEGEHIAVVGDSGCGKSTLLKILAGLYEPDGGSMSVAGESLPEKIRTKVAVVMQRFDLFPLSIRDNITCGHGISEKRLWDACRSACLDGWIESLPEGLSTHVGERGGQVSGGQAQRICIARALCKDAEVILLDEPLSALDRGTEQSVMLALGRLTAGKTVIHVTHHPEALEEGYRICRMEGGRLSDG